LLKPHREIPATARPAAAEIAIAVFLTRRALEVGATGAGGVTAAAGVEDGLTGEEVGPVAVAVVVEEVSGEAVVVAVGKESGVAAEESGTAESGATGAGGVDGATGEPDDGVVEGADVTGSGCSSA